MKIFMCDLCLQEKAELELKTILEKFMTKRTKHVCSSCEKIINDFLWDIKLAISGLEAKAVKAFIEKLENKEGKEN